MCADGFQNIGLMFFNRELFACIDKLKIKAALSSSLKVPSRPD